MFPFHFVVLITFGSVNGILNGTGYILDSTLMDKFCPLLSTNIFTEPVWSNIGCTARCESTRECNSVIVHSTVNKMLCWGFSSYLGCTRYMPLQGIRFYRKAKVPDCGNIVHFVEGHYGVAESQITASSNKQGYAPGNARLDNSHHWSPDTTNGHVYLQVDFQVLRNVTGVITQGSCCDDNNWIETYTFQYSLDCDEFTAITVTESEVYEKIFKGNNDSSTHVSQILATPVIGRCVRLNPQAWHIWPDLRLEVLGCEIPAIN